MIDEVHEVFDIVDFRMAIGGYGRLADRNAANPGDLAGHFRGGQNTSFAGFGALGQLHLNHLHLRFRRKVAEFFLVKPAVLIAHAVFRRADLENNIATAFKVIRRQAAFAGVHIAPCKRRPFRQGAHRRFRQRAVAHGRNADDRGNAIRVGRVRAELDRRRVCGFLVKAGKSAVHENRRTDEIKVSRGTKGERVGAAFCRLVNPVPLGAIKRHLFAVQRKKVLAEEFPEPGEKFAKAANDGIVVTNGVAGLADIGEKHDDNGERADANDKDEKGGEKLNAAHGEPADPFHDEIPSPSNE